MTRALGHVRVSSEEQAPEGVSLDAQAERITVYANALGWELVGMVRDEGRSAANLRRPGMQGILADVARPKARAWDALVAVKLDRLTRSVRDLCTLVEAFERGAVHLVSIAESVDTGSAAGKLFLNIIDALGQWEREVIGERTADALAHLKAQGRRISGRAPFGFTFGEDGAVIPCEREQQTLFRILALRASGASLSEVSKALALSGHVNRCGKPYCVSALSLLVTREREHEVVTP